MRSLTAAILWLFTTVALAVAVPAAWAQANVIDANGYAAFAQEAAADPGLQQGVAAELTEQLVDLGYTGNETVLRGVTSLYTTSAAFPGQFGQANQLAHRWMFTNSVASDTDEQGRWVIDLAPMLADRSFSETLQRFNISVPQSLPVPLTQNAPDSIRPGQLSALATWGPWVRLGSVIATAVLALLTVAAARSRGKAIAALGVSGLLVGAAGWAAVEIGRRRADTALDGVTDNIQQIANGLIGHVVDSLHSWFNLTLAAGVALVVAGVVVAALGGMRKSKGAQA